MCFLGMGALTPPPSLRRYLQPKSLCQELVWPEWGFTAPHAVLLERPAISPRIRT
jgi:hypothetical protein